ncbi:MAG: dienelactone hydrolase family protein [Bacteroidales bacterium]|jgi:pimeloyl-ACP methyl ester carboxylesterase|nr:dienelactone hydrolase family protein [Bacteroidales bacterium]
MRYCITILFVCLFSGFISSQEKITFVAEDGLLVTADLYKIDAKKPYVLLFHQAGFSRGEYKEAIPKILKFGYNCLAVDLRSGGEVNYIQNHTALLATEKGFPIDYLSSQKDILAAIKWVSEQTRKPVILFGSSFSASLCLILAENNPNVKAVIAFSPGEFFVDQVVVKDKLAELKKPVFVASSKRENPYVTDLLSLSPSTNKMIFAPSDGAGEHGSKSLWKSNPTNNEYWFALTMFFSKIK